MTVNVFRVTFRVNVLVICVAVLQANAPPKSVDPVVQNAKRVRADDARIVAYAKQLDVSRLDPTLPKRPLEEWMREHGVPADATLWEVVRGCSQHPDGMDPQMMPLCVDFKILHGDCAGRPCAAIWGTIEVGIVRDGVTGEPRIWHITFSTRLEYGSKDWEYSEKLSELPRLIAKLKRY
jgi:hypothetical protein